MIVTLFGLNLCAGSREKKLSGGPESGPVWGLEYISNSSRLAPLWEPN